ncbi:hypothetical protein [Methyloversatilis sp. XJ19-49]|jgi:hypothetical protein|uniref:hypothetical protein n=1 Tax=Methyloversatilis sp. XJ19-49 TaxID=2963429 RepID=UPI00211BC42D|nr:hypothetical protein [Methyloversatilis sp. XJ19-49]MCQ9377831.1 hypothetical protein [Methyloversatilis sp. XJ19-49]
MRSRVEPVGYRRRFDPAAQLRDAGCRILEISEAECGMGSALAHAARGIDLPVQLLR